jgi:hypothetical protein
MVSIQTSTEKVPSIAEKVLRGKPPTPEETKNLAAAAARKVDAEKAAAASLAGEVAAGDHEPTPEETKSLAASVLIDEVRTKVADDSSLSKREKATVIKYLDAIEAMTRDYEPERDAPAVRGLTGGLTGILGKVTKRVGEGVVVQQVLGLVTKLTDVLL